MAKKIGPEIISIDANDLRVIAEFGLPKEKVDALMFVVRLVGKVSAS